MIKRYYKREVGYVMNSFRCLPGERKKQTLWSPDERMTQNLQALVRSRNWARGFMSPASTLSQQCHGNFEQSGSRNSLLFLREHACSLIHVDSGVLRSTQASKRKEARTPPHSYRILTRLDRKGCRSYHCMMQTSITNALLAAAAVMLI